VDEAKGKAKGKRHKTKQKAKIKIKPNETQIDLCNEIASVFGYK
jgi:hypothetical protein